MRSANHGQLKAGDAAHSSQALLNDGWFHRFSPLPWVAWSVYRAEVFGFRAFLSQVWRCWAFSPGPLGECGRGDQQDAHGAKSDVL